MHKSSKPRGQHALKKLRSRIGKTHRKTLAMELLEPRYVMEANPWDPSRALSRPEEGSSPATAGNPFGAIVATSADPVASFASTQAWTSMLDHVPEGLAGALSDEVIRSMVELTRDESGLIVIDPALPGAGAIFSSFGGNDDVLWMSSLEELDNGLDARLSAGRKYDAIHFVTHGSSGAIYVGGVRSDIAGLERLGGTFARLDEIAGQGAVLHLWGCDMAAGEAGQRFVGRVAELSGLPVSASIDTTGPQVLGGDFELEYAIGFGGSASLLPEAESLWQTTLADPPASPSSFTALSAPKLVDATITYAGNAVAAAGARVTLASYVVGDRLRVPAAPSGGYASTFKADERRLEIAPSTPGGTFTAAELNPILRQVTLSVDDPFEATQRTIEFFGVEPTTTLSGSVSVTSAITTPTAIDASLSYSGGSVTKIVAEITSGFVVGDTLSIAAGAYSKSYDIATRQLTITSTTPLTASVAQGIARGISFNTAGSTETGQRQVSIAIGGGEFVIGDPVAIGVSAVELGTAADSIKTAFESIETNIGDNFNLPASLVGGYAAGPTAQQIFFGPALESLRQEPGFDNLTLIPFANATVRDLFYPPSGETQDSQDDSPLLVLSLGKALHPSVIGKFLSISTEAGITGLAESTKAGEFRTALEGAFGAVAQSVGASTPTVGLDFVIDRDETTGAATSVDYVITMTATKGSESVLDLGKIAEDLGLKLIGPATATLGAGASIGLVFRVNVATGGVTTLFDTQRTGAFAGVNFSELDNPITIGVIGGELVDASGSIGVVLPLDFGGGSGGGAGGGGGAGATSPLVTWSGTAVSDFAAESVGTASLELPLTASIGGVLATTADTKVVVTDNDIFDDVPPVYMATDYDNVRWFAGVAIEDVLQEILTVGGIYQGLASTDSELLGLPVPLVEGTVFADLFDFDTLYQESIAKFVDVVDPVLNTIGRDELLDPRLPVSDDSEPRPAMYSDLLGGFRFGIVVNNQYPVHQVIVPARANRNSLNDLVADINAAIPPAAKVRAANEGNKLVFRVTELQSVRTFAVVPIAPELVSGALPQIRSNGGSPFEAQTIGDVLSGRDPGLFLVKGTLAGIAIGTNYYSGTTTIGAAAVHAGLLAENEIGVVRIDGADSRFSIGSTRNGITSAFQLSGSVHLVSSGAPDIARLGATDIGSPLASLQVAEGGKVTGSLPLRSVIGKSSFVIGQTDSTAPILVEITPQANVSVETTFEAIKATLAAALAAAGAGGKVGVRLVDDDGLVVYPLDGLTDEEGNPIAQPPLAGDVYLQFFINENGPGEAWSTLEVGTNGDQRAHELIEIGFLVGDVAARPRPAALRTFDDLTKAEIFGDLRMVPVYDPVTQVVKLEFKAADNATSVTLRPRVDFSVGPLGSVTFNPESPEVTISSSISLAFGLDYKIGPSGPAVVAAAKGAIASGQLTGDAEFSVDLVLRDRYGVKVEQGWTSGNATVQDLVSDINRGLSSAKDSAGQTSDLIAENQLIARYGVLSGRIELVTATLGNNAAAVAIPSGVRTGKLSSDLNADFVYGGKTWRVTVAAAETSDSDTLHSRLSQLNFALARAEPLDGSGNPGPGQSLINAIFFTTRSTSGGNTEVLIGITDPSSNDWAGTVRMTAARENSAVKELGFDDGGKTPLSETVSRMSGLSTTVVTHGDSSEAFATGVVSATLPTNLSGTVTYGMNNMAFTASQGSIDIDLSLVIDEPTRGELLASEPNAYLVRALTGGAGSEFATAGIVLKSLTPNTGAIASGSTIEIEIPDLRQSAVKVARPVGVPLPMPFDRVADDGFTLTEAADDVTLNFIYSGQRYSITVTKAQAEAGGGNASLADLVDDFNDSLASQPGTGGAKVRVGSVMVPAGDLSGDFEVRVVGSRAQVFAFELADNPDFAEVTFLPNLGAFGEVGMQGSFGIGTVADAIQVVMPIFATVEEQVGAYSTFVMPVMESTLGSVLNLDEGLTRRLASLRSQQVADPTQIGPAVARSLGLAADDVRVTFDAGIKSYRVDIRYQTGRIVTANLDFDPTAYFELKGEDYPPGLGVLYDGGGKAPLVWQVGGTSVLSIGIDLTDPTSPRPFVYPHDGGEEFGLENGTSFRTTVEGGAEGLEFSAGSGSLGVFIKEGEAAIDDAAITVTLKPPATGIYYLTGQGGADPFVGDSFAEAYEGAVSMSLPLFAPSEFKRLPSSAGGSSFEFSIGDLAVYAAQSEIIREQVALLAGTDNDAAILQTIAAARALLGSNVYSISSPNVLDALGSVRETILVDMLADPALFLDGIDGFLGTIESGLRKLSDLPIPIIGDALGDAAKGVFGWRRGWLSDLRAKMRGAGASIFDVVREGVFDFLGPSGLGILLVDNGIRTVEGMIEATTPEDVLIGFIDRSGEPLEEDALGAYGFEFRVRLGQQIVDTGLDISFDFDALAPVVELAVDGGLRFQLGWDLFIGFGFNLDDGFYVVVDSDRKSADAPELQLRFDAFLDPASSDYAVDYIAGKWVIVDGSGVPVNDPNTGKPYRAIAVDEEGVNRTAEVPIPGGEEEIVCGCGDEEILEDPVWWVVATPAGLAGKFNEWDELVAIGGSGPYAVDSLIEVDAVKPFQIRGSLFFLDLIATDMVRTGLRGVTDYDQAYYYAAQEGPQVDFADRDHPTDGVNRNNYQRTVVSGFIGVEIADPSNRPDTAENKGIPASTITKFALANKDNVPILDAYGKAIPVRKHYAIRLLDPENPVAGQLLSEESFYIPVDLLNTGLLYDFEVSISLPGENGDVTYTMMLPSGTIVTNVNNFLDQLHAKLPAIAQSQVEFGFQRDLSGTQQIDFLPEWYAVFLRPGGNKSLIQDYEVRYKATDDPSPGRITINELRQAGRDLVQLRLQAYAVANFRMELSIDGNPSFPKIFADFNLDWNTRAKQTASAPASGSQADPGVDPQKDKELMDLRPEIGLSNIQLDLGTFLTRLMKPIVSEIDEAIEPLDPVIDAVTAEIPVISDIAGRKVDLVDLLKTFGGPKGQAIGTLIDVIVAVRKSVEILNAVEDGRTMRLPLGRFWIPKVVNGTSISYGSIIYENSALGLEPPLVRPGQEAATLKRALDNLEAQNKGNPDNTQPGIASIEKGGFSFPIMEDPVSVFRLLMGEDVPLVTYSLPKVRLSLGARIPLIRIIILEVGLRFQIDVQAQLHMGYDTYGLRRFAGSGDIADTLHGFYLSDRDRADGSGSDVDELKVVATLALYGGVDLLLARAGIEGGFTFTAIVNFNDPNNDGKLRLTEAIELVSYTGNVLDLVDVYMKGEVYARFYYWVGLAIWTPWKTYQITIIDGGHTFARATVFELRRDGSDGPPNPASLATIDGKKTLVLHAGPNAPKRVSNQDPLKTKDGDERFKVWREGNSVKVQYLNYSQKVFSYDGVEHVFFDGGIGNDSLDASGLFGIPVSFSGGSGNDTITLGSVHGTLPSTIDGDLGNDVIKVLGSGVVIVRGGLGDDELEGGTGVVTIDPGAGNDKVKSKAGSRTRVTFNRQFGANDLVLDPGAIENVLDFNGASSPIEANVSGVGSIISAGAADKATFDLAAVTTIIGSQSSDRFLVTNPTTRNANGGIGLVLQGGLGNDSYEYVINDTSGVAADGITIDDMMLPTEVATAQVTECGRCGEVCKIEVVTPGAGYKVAPDVVIVDESGAGATAVAGIDDEGRVTGIYVTRKGLGYSMSPTVLLMNPVSYSDRFIFSSSSSDPTTLNRGGNGIGDYRILLGGKSFKFVGYSDNDEIGVTRPVGYDHSEVDNVDIRVPNSVLTLAQSIDLYGSLDVQARRMEQDARIVADGIKITTDHGFQVRHPIDAVNNGSVTIQVTGNNLANYAGSWAAATAVVEGTSLASLNVTNQGDHYWFAPSVTFRGANGEGGRAVATVANGKITGIEVLTPGQGYFQAPRPDVIIAPPASIQVDSMITSTMPGSKPGFGDGRGRVTLFADKGSVATAGEVFFPESLRDGEPRGVPAIDWLDGDFRFRYMIDLEEIVSPSEFPGVSVGSGAEFTAVLNADGEVVGFNKVSGGSGYTFDLPPSVEIQGEATAVPVVGGDGSIVSLRVTYPGSGYGQPPKVFVRPNGFGRVVASPNGQTLTAAGELLNRVHIQAAGGKLVTVAGIQVGDPIKPIKSDVETFVAQVIMPATAKGGGVHLLEKDELRIGYDLAIDGIQTIDSPVSITLFNGVLELGAPVQRIDGQGRLLWQDAAKTIPIYKRDSSGNIVYDGGQITVGDAAVKLTADDIQVNVPLNQTGQSGDRLILQPVKIGEPIGLAGTRAAARAVMSGGGIASIDMTWMGRGYDEPPLVTVAPPGERAYGLASVAAGAVNAIEVVFGGTNYVTTDLPVVELTGGGFGGLTPGVDGRPGRRATAVAVVDSLGTVSGITITDAGSGYVESPTVRIALPGRQALVTAVLDLDNPDPATGKYQVKEFVVIEPGTNYPYPPKIDVTAPHKFTVDDKEILMFKGGFEDVVIGRIDGHHTLYAPASDFHYDGVVLRTPRFGGDMVINSLSSNGPVVLIGSGNTVNLTTASPTIFGSSISIDDNIVVHSGVSGLIEARESSIEIFGNGKGKIDGISGGSNQDMTLDAISTITVTGAIGSTTPLNDLTLLSRNRQAINLQSSVRVSGDFTITGGNLSVGGDVTVGEDLIIEDAATILFGGNLNVSGNLTIRKATSITFAGTLTVGGTLTIGNDTLPLVTERVTGTTTFENAVIANEAFVSSNTSIIVGQGFRTQTGNAVFTTDNIEFDGSANSVIGPTGTRKDLVIKPITLSRPIRFASPAGDAEGTLDISDRDVKAIAAGWNLVVIGDEDRGTGTVSLGSIGLNTPDNPRLNNATTLVGGSVRVDETVNVLSSANFLELVARTGDVEILAAMNQNPAERNAWLRMQAYEDIRIEAPIRATSTISLIAGGTIWQATDAKIETNLLPIISGLTVTLPDLNNELNELAMQVGNSARLQLVDRFSSFDVPFPQLPTGANTDVTLRDRTGFAITQITTTDSSRANAQVTVTGIDARGLTPAATTDVRLIVDGGSGVVTQTQPILADGLALYGEDDTFTLGLATNNVNTLAADVGQLLFVDFDDVTVGTVTTTKLTTPPATTTESLTGIKTLRTTTVEAGRDLIVASGASVASELAVSLVATNNIDIDGSVTSTSASVAINAGTGVTVDAAVDASTTLSIAAVSGNLSTGSAGTLTSGGAMQVVANQNVSLGAAAESGSTVLITAVNGGMTLAAAGDIISEGGVALTAGTGFTTAGDITTNNGTVDLIGPSVMLTGDVRIDSVNQFADGIGGANVEIDGTVNGNFTLTIVAGNGSVEFGGAIGNTAPLASLDVTGTHVDFTTSVATVGAQKVTADTIDAAPNHSTTNSPLTLDGDITLTNDAVFSTGTGSAALTLGGIIGGGHDLDLRSGGGQTLVTGNVTGVGSLRLQSDAATSTGTVRFEGQVSAQELVTYPRPYIVEFVGSSTTIQSATTFNNTAGVTLGDGGDTLDFHGGLTSIASTTTLGGTVTTSGQDIVFGTVLVGANAEVTTGPGAGNIDFGSTIDSTGGTFGLVVNAGSGSVTFDGAIGAVSPLASLDVSGTTSLDAGSVTTTGTQRYRGNMTLGADTTLSGSSVTFDGTLAGSTDGGEGLTIDGGATFNGTVGGGAGRLEFLDITGATSINTASVRTTGAQSYDGTLTLVASTHFETNNSGVTVTGAVSGTVSGQQALQISTGSGNVDLQGAVGSPIALASLTITTTGIAEFGDDVTTTGAQTVTASTIRTTGDHTTSNANILFTGNMVLDGDSSLKTGSGAGDITVTGTISGNHALNLAAGTGSIRLGGEVGGNAAPLTSLTVESATEVTLSDDVTTTGQQSYTAGSVKTSGVLTTSGNDIVITGNLVLDAATSMTTGASPLIGDIIVTGTITGAQTLSLTAGAGEIDLRGNVGTGGTPLASLTIVSADIAIFGGSVTTTGDQSITASTIRTGGTHTTSGNDILLTGNVELQGATSLTTGAAPLGGDILVTGTVRGAQSFDLTAGAGSIDLGGNIGTQATPLTSLTIHSAVRSELPNEVWTLGGQTLRSTTLVLQGTQTTSGGKILLDGGVELAGDLKLDTGSGAGDVELTGAVTVVGSPASLEVAAGTGNITFLGDLGTSSDPLASLTIPSGRTVDLRGDVTTSGDQSITAATIKTDGNYTAGGDFLWTGDVTLQGDTTVDLNGGDFRVTGDIIGLSGLTVQDAGEATFEGDVKTGGAQSIEADTVRLSGEHATDAALLEIIGDLILDGPVALRTSGGDVRVTGTIDGAESLLINSRVTIGSDTGAGEITLGGAIGGVTPLMSLEILGPMTLSGTGVTTTGNQSYAGPVELTGDTTFKGPMLRFDGLIDGAGSITFDGDVELRGDVESVGDQDYRGEVEFLGTDQTIRSDGNIRWADTVYALTDVVVEATGEFELASGGSVEFASGKDLTIRSGSIDLSGPGKLIGSGGSLTLAPLGNVTSGIGGPDDPSIDHHLSSAELLLLAGWGNLVVGSPDGNQDLTLKDMQFGIPVEFRTGGSITVIGSLQATTSTASIALIAGRDLNVNDKQITTINGKIRLEADADRSDGYDGTLRIATAESNKVGAVAITSIGGDIELVGGAVAFGTDPQIRGAWPRIVTSSGDLSILPGILLDFDLLHPSSELTAGGALVIGQAPNGGPENASFNGGGITGDSVDIFVAGELKMGPDVRVRAKGFSGETDITITAGGELDVLASSFVSERRDVIFREGGAVVDNETLKASPFSNQIEQGSELANLRPTRVTNISLLVPVVQEDLTFGSKGRVAVDIENIGKSTAVGIIDVRLFLSSDAVQDEFDIRLGQYIYQRIRMVPGAKKTYFFDVTIPEGLPLGPEGVREYRLIGTLISNSAISSAMPGNQEVLFAAPLTIRNRAVAWEPTAPVLATTPALPIFEGLPLVGGGQSVGLTLGLTNEGNITGTARGTLEVWMMSGSTFDESQGRRVGTVAINSSIGRNLQRSLAATATIPSDMPAGTYRFWNRFVPSTGSLISGGVAATVAAPVSSGLVRVAPSDLRASVVTHAFASIVQPGTSGNVTVAFVNDGNARVAARGTVSVQVWADVAGGPSVKVGQRDGIAVNLAPLAGQSVVIPTAIPTNSGIYTLRAVIDSGLALTDANRGNNELIANSGAAIDVRAPFVDVATSLEGAILPTTSLWSGRTFDVNVRLANLGSLAATGTGRLELLAAPDGDVTRAVLVGSLTRRLSIAAQSTFTVAVRGTIPQGLVAGDYQLIADWVPTGPQGTLSGLTYPDASGDNNRDDSGAGRFRVVATDLRADSISTALGSLVQTGQSDVATVTFAVPQSATTVAQGRVTVSVYATGVSQPLGTSAPITLSGVRPGAAALRATVPIVYPQAVGDYSLYAVVNPDGALAETDVAPNRIDATAPVRVATPFVDIGLTINAAPLRLTGGQSGALTIRMTNNGNQIATGSGQILIDAIPVAGGEPIRLSAVPATMSLRTRAFVDRRLGFVLGSNVAAGDYDIRVTFQPTTIPQALGSTQGVSNSLLRVTNPDLAVTKVELIGTPITFRPFQTLITGARDRMVVTVENRGLGRAVGKVDIIARAIHIPRPGEPQRETYEIGRLAGRSLSMAPNGRAVFTVPIAQMPIDAGDFIFEAEVFSDSRIAEAGGSGNALANNRLGTDKTLVRDKFADLTLAVEKVVAPTEIYPGVRMSFTVAVGNLGNTVAAGDAKVTIFASKSERIDTVTDFPLAIPLFESAERLNLKPDATYRKTLSFNLPPKLEHGENYYFFARIVPGSTLAFLETSDATTPNHANAEGVIPGGKLLHRQPDWRAENVTPSWANGALPGASGTVRVTIRNVTAIPVIGSVRVVVRAQQLDDSNEPVGDPVTLNLLGAEGDLVTLNLAAANASGDSRVVSVRATLPTTPGRYRIEATVLGANGLEDFDVTNNSARFDLLTVGV